MRSNKMQPMFEGEGGPIGGAPAATDTGTGTATPTTEEQAILDKFKPVSEDAETSFDLSTDLWNDNPEDDGQQNQQTGQQQQQQQTGQQQAGQQQQSESEVFDAHVASLEFGDLGMDDEAVTAFFDSRDLKGLQDGLKTQAQSLYKRVMLDAGKLVQAQTKTILEQARTEAKNLSSADKDRSLLQATLPFTKEIAVAPVAESVMARAKAMGKNPEQAVEVVRQFFKATSKLGAKELDVTVNAPAPGSNGFNAQNTGGETGVVPEDWAEFLGPATG